MTNFVISYVFLRIVVDRREKSSSIPELLMKAGITVDFATLKVGDYVISSNTAVERKTVHDLLKSIYDGRLFIQCSQLIKYFPSPLIIIEGNIKDLELLYESKNLPYSDKTRSIYESISAIILDFRIPLINTPSGTHTTNLLVAMAYKSLQEHSDDGPLLRKIKKSKQEYLQQLSVLSSLPGVGSKLGARMLEEFNTPKRALNASVAELAKIPGFGRIRAQKVREVLDKKSRKSNEEGQPTLLEHMK